MPDKLTNLIGAGYEALIGALTDASDRWHQLGDTTMRDACYQQITQAEHLLTELHQDTR